MPVRDAQSPGAPKWGTVYRQELWVGLSAEIQQHSVKSHFTVGCSPCVSKEWCFSKISLVNLSPCVSSLDLLGVK